VTARRKSKPGRASLRANARLPLFQKDGDYEACERILVEAHEAYDVPIRRPMGPQEIDLAALHASVGRTVGRTDAAKGRQYRRSPIG